jgi:hypothetical protein
MNAGYPRVSPENEYVWPFAARGNPIITGTQIGLISQLAR